MNGDAEIGVTSRKRVLPIGKKQKVCRQRASRGNQHEHDIKYS